MGLVARRRFMECPEHGASTVYPDYENDQIRCRRCHAEAVEVAYVRDDAYRGAVDALDRLATAVENVSAYGARHGKSELARAWEQARAITHPRGEA